MSLTIAGPRALQQLRDSLLVHSLIDTYHDNQLDAGARRQRAVRRECVLRYLVRICADPRCSQIAITTTTSMGTYSLATQQLTEADPVGAQSQASYAWLDIGKIPPRSIQ